MNHSDLFRLKQLIEQINRQALMQIVENEQHATFDTHIANNSVLTNIAECSLEAKDIISKEIENAGN